MNALLRVIGVAALESLASRMSARAATAVQFLLVVAGTALPLIPLLSGAVRLQDLLAYLVLAQALSVAGTLVRLRTLADPPPQAKFFMLHYALMNGILSVVCGVFAVILLVIAGPSGGWAALVPTAAALVLAHAWSLADGWFARGGRRVARTWQVVLPGYLRFVPLLVGTVLGAIAIMGQGPATGTLPIAVGLVVAQTAIDLSLALAALLLPNRRTRTHREVASG